MAKDLSPKSTMFVPAEKEIVMPTLDMPMGQRIGGLSMFGDSFKRGSGANVFGASNEGIWLGAADFADAPFRVDMDGNVYITTDDGSIIFDATNKRIIVNDGTHDRVLIGYLLNGF